MDDPPEPLPWDCLISNGRQKRRTPSRCHLGWPSWQPNGFGHRSNRVSSLTTSPTWTWS